jgi:hypothetical protein
MSGPVPDLFTLGVTTLSLVDAAPGLTDRLLLTESTNVHNLAHDPLRVLGASAFWVGGTRLPWKVGVRFLLVTAPAERWLGTGRWLLAFAAGHVGATLVTVSGIAYGIHAGWLGQGSPPSATSASAMGSSRSPQCSPTRSPGRGGGSGRALSSATCRSPRRSRRHSLSRATCARSASASGCTR